MRADIGRGLGWRLWRSYRYDIPSWQSLASRGSPQHHCATYRRCSPAIQPTAVRIAAPRRPRSLGSVRPRYGWDYPLIPRSRASEGTKWIPPEIPFAETSNDGVVSGLRFAIPPEIPFAETRTDPRSIGERHNSSGRGIWRQERRAIGVYRSFPGVVGQCDRALSNRVEFERGRAGAPGDGRSVPERMGMSFAEYSGHFSTTQVSERSLLRYSHAERASVSWVGAAESKVVRSR